MLTNLSIDSLYEICSFLSTSELLKFSFTCSLYYNCLLKDVRIMKEHKFTLKDNIDELDFMDCMSYKILNLDLNSNANITDDNFTYLKGIHTLNMLGCGEITNEGLIHLKSIHKLDISGCSQITDEGLMHLKGIHTLIMLDCNKITDKGLIHLKSIHTLNMTGCKGITDEGLIHFKCINPSFVISPQPNILSV